MVSAEFWCSYGAMRHEELVGEATHLRAMRLLREARGPRMAAILVHAGRAIAELGRSLEAAGRPVHRTPAHG